MSVAIAESTSDALTLVIAIVGLVLAAASLAWQAATFLMTGARVKVKLQRGALGPGGCVLGPVSGGMPPEELAQQGYVDPVLAVEVTNVGRLPTTITGWHAVLENGILFSNPLDPTNPELPYRLEAQSRAIWYADLRAIQAAVTASYSSGVTKQAHQKVGMSVDLASGKTIETKETLDVQA